MKRFILMLTLLAGAAAILFGAGLFFFFSFGHFQEVENRTAANCTTVLGIPGIDDFSAGTGDFVYISSLDRRASDETRGAILRFDIKNPLDRSSWGDRTGGVPAKFEPAGIDFYEGSEGNRLFVLNNIDATVLIYDIETTGDLTLKRTLSDPRLTDVNDIVAVGPHQFYVTKSFAGKGGTLYAKFQYLLKRRSGQIFHYDGNSWSIAADGLAAPNGIEVDALGAHLYISETTTGRILSFKRDTQTGALALRHMAQTTTFPDSLEWLEEGTLIFSANPKPLSVARFAKVREALSPAQAGTVKVFGGDLTDVNIWYQNDGSQLSGATAAAAVGNKRLIGGFMEDKFLLCE